MVMLRILARRLGRTIRSTRGPFLAITAVIAIGVLVYIAMNSAYNWLEGSQQSFYQDYDFADYYFHVVRAPQEVIRRIEAVPGVARASGRIQKDLPILKPDGSRATGRLTGYNLPMEGEVNRICLLSGRLFEKYPHGGGLEALVDPQYAAANGLAPGDKITVVAEGRQVFITVVGTATGPEFVYPMKDAAAWIPEPERFGIVMLPQNQLQQILGLSGQINQVLIKMTPGADEAEAAAEIGEILRPYGVLADYPRKQQLSHAVLQGEMDQLRATSRTLPAIFLGIAAAVQWVMLGRLVKSQRQQIGVMKALGYSNWQVLFYYTSYALAVALAGGILGIILGLFSASAIFRTYALYFNLPPAAGGLDYATAGYALLISLGVGMASGMAASRGVLAVRPAESMRPSPPLRVRKTLLENWRWAWGLLSAAWKMSLRSIGRQRMRFVMVVTGVIFAVSLLIVAFFMNDAIDYMLEEHFYKEQKYDFLVRFSSPLSAGELLYLSRLSGVQKAEPLLEIPAAVYFGGRKEEHLLVGLQPGTEMKEIADAAGEPAAIPEEGVLLNKRLADKLGIKIGDNIEVETRLGIGPARRAYLKVVGFTQKLVGAESYLSLSEANWLLGERDAASGAMLRVDPGQAEAVEKELNAMTGVHMVLSREKELNNFLQYLDTALYFTAVMAAFAVVLGFAIIYNAALVNFSERRRELALLRVMGYTVRETASVMWRETILQALLGVALGLPAGRLLTAAYLQAVESDLYSFPAVIYPDTYFLAAAGGIFFTAAAQLLAARGIKRLDLAEILRSQD